MAKQKKEPAAQKQSRRSRVEASLSMESAETLGRVIGTLQRQLDSAIQRFSEGASRHTPRLHTPDAPVRSPRNAKRPRLADDMTPVRRTSATANGKVRGSGNGATRRMVKRVERPK